MTSSKSRMLRWLVPVGAAALITAGTVTVSAIAASGDAALPARSAGQLLVDVQQAQLGAVSGTVVQTSDLGIPNLPGMGGDSGSSNLQSLVSGTHTLRIWYDGADKARVALLGTLGESDVIRNGADLWTWSSTDNAATHRTLTADPAMSAGRHADSALPTPVDPADLPKTPQEAADAVLKAMDPTTSVTTDGSATVAGRPVYQLTLRPRAIGSLVSSIVLAIDAAKHIPLRVQVFAVDHRQPAFEVAFSSVDFATPDPAQFTFNPPPGAQVTQERSATPVPQDKSATPVPQDKARGADGARSGVSDAAAPKTVGSGWTTVLVADSSSLPSSGPISQLSSELPTVSGTWGTGHLFSGTLFSAVLTSDGRVAIGAVRPTVLYAALGAG